MVLDSSGTAVGKIYESVLVPAFIWDNRDNIFWSSKGYYASLSLQFSDAIISSSKEYGVVSGWVNGYHTLLKSSRNLILAWHLYAQTAWGDLPYIRYANYGQGDEVTGYTRGKYVNNSEVAIQAELRYELWKFISCGGYLGTGKVFTYVSSFGQSKWLHYGGLRLYFNIIPSRNIRLRVDGAIGRQDWGFYVGIGQAF
jgi:outer membrane protein assembly factor BamA